MFLSALIKSHPSSTARITNFPLNTWRDKILLTSGLTFFDWSQQAQHQVYLRWRTAWNFVAYVIMWYFSHMVWTRFQIHNCLFLTDNINTEIILKEKRLLYNFLFNSIGCDDWAYNCSPFSPRKSLWVVTVGCVLMGRQSQMTSQGKGTFIPLYWAWIEASLAQAVGPKELVPLKTDHMAKL